MAINTQPFNTLVSNFVAAVQGAASDLVDFSVGSILRSFSEAVSAIALWLQGLALQIAALTRFSTSNGTDADSWAADFGFSRLAAISATGSVVFARFTPSNSAAIPVGAIVQTADGTETYAVIADKGQSAFDVPSQTYIMAAGVASCAATVLAVTPGAGSNAVPGSINTIGSPISGVDTVSNPFALISGADPEADSAFRLRFVSYIASLSKATKTAVGAAIAGVQVGLSYSIVENTSYGGVYQPGFFYAVVDDGTGFPSATLLATVSNAIDAVRPIGSTFQVFAPLVVTANTSLSITTANGYSHPTLVASVVAAIIAYINTLPIGTTLRYTRLAQIAYDVSPGITNVSAVLLNAGTTDLVATSQQVIKAGTTTVN
jgi:uncharacterized phage protein gp47/JayE